MKPLIIDNQETSYLISEEGQIYNTKTKKYLTGTIRSGYQMVKLTINKKKKDFLVHRLVALTFLDNPLNLPQVNHKDRNKLNNCVDNLEWVTESENMQHANKTGKKERQPIISVNEEIDAINGWVQYKDTNYWLCKDGRCANKKTNKFLNPVISADGYARYYLYIDGVRTTKQAHRMMYETFIGEIGDYQINHIDGNKINNSISNLEAVTPSENMNHSYYILKKNVKSIIQYDLSFNIIKEYPSISQAARELKIDASGICQACKGDLWTYKGYIWKYKEV